MEYVFSVLGVRLAVDARHYDAISQEKKRSEKPNGHRRARSFPGKEFYNFKLRRRNKTKQKKNKIK